MLMLKYTVVTSPFEHNPLLPMSPLVTILGYPPPPGFPIVGRGGPPPPPPHLTIFFKTPKFFNDILGRPIAVTQKPDKMVIGSRTETEKTLL